MSAGKRAVADMTEEKRAIELLAPAKNHETAVQAILHGADAVYMGASSHGARKSAANSLEDISKTVEFAHTYRARVYATVNTVVYDSEIAEVERLIWELYRAGVDALIIQDMGILRMRLPDIELHASTQCDTRTVAKAKFLEDVGMSQIVLARELSLNEIRKICQSVEARIECFVHGALCVSYSGRCQASLSSGGRSANRGECAQICRLPWTLTDTDGRVLEKDKYLLSLKDLNLTERVDELMDAGVSSFKIEGRLKDVSYVKNVVANYRRIIDEAIAANPGRYRRSSYGTSEISFTPKVDKSFNRTFTRHFIDGLKPVFDSRITSRTAGSAGESIQSPSELHTGDGITYFDKQKGCLTGAYINSINQNFIETSTGQRLPTTLKMSRTYDRVFETALAKPTATRRLDVDITLRTNSLSATDEMGNEATVEFCPALSPANKPANRREVMAKMGSTPYRLRDFNDEVGTDIFIPNSQIADARRRMLEALERSNIASYPYGHRLTEKSGIHYPENELDYRDNVTNRLAETFYRGHGVTKIERGVEASGKALTGRKVMTCRHCILRDTGRCLKTNGKNLKQPLYITSGDKRFSLQFDCKRCEMSLIKVK